VIVTAQKRSENLQDVPISVDVVSAQSLAEQNHNALEDLAQSIPGMNITSRSGSNLITIRGVGSGENSSFDQSVGMFTDDIYHGRSRMSLAAFLDLDRIEVLKGPQSTFFGNNAIAGALNIVTKKPGSAFDAWGRLLYGQFGQYVAEGALGGPITDTFGLRLAVTRNGDNRGWIDNLNTGQKIPIVNNTAGRLTLDFHPDDLDVILKVEGSRHRTSGSANELPGQLTCPPPAPLAVGFVAFGSCVYALAHDLPTRLDENSVSQLGGQSNSLSTFEDVLTVSYQRWEQIFTSVTGFYNYHFNSNSDATELPVNTQVSFALPEKYHQFSQEFRITSPTGQSLEYVAGAYFQTDRLDVAQEINAPLFNAIAPFFGVSPQYLPLAIDLPFSENEHIYSVFGSLKWNVTENLQLTTGLRASHVTKDAVDSRQIGSSTGTYCCFVAALPPDIVTALEPAFGKTGSVSVGRADNGLMPSAGIQYHVNPSLMAYFRYDRGFKAGGNSSGTFGPAATLTFDPEHVNAYELGVKSQWLDDTVLINADVFRMDYRGLQVPAVITTIVNGQQIQSQQTRNAAASASQGVELEAEWVASRSFRLRADVTYLDSYYSNYPNAPPTVLQQYCAGAGVYAATPQCAKYPDTPQGLGVFDATGQPTAYAPRWSGSIKADYSIGLPGGYVFLAEASPFFTSSFNPDPDLDVRNNGYMRLDARLSLATSDERWALDVIGKNLTDRTIIVFPTIAYQTKQQPRNFAAQIRFRW
jgi:outer membrane receptor protein involved in Fe transport